MTEARVLTLTMNPALDKSTAVGQVVADRKLRCETPRWDPGGGGINVSRVLRRLGVESRAVYPAGGPPGDLIARLLEAEGVDQLRIPIAEWTRENLTVLEHSSGRQFRFGLPGPALGEAEWRQCLEAIESQDPPPSLIVAGGSLPPGAPLDFFAQLARVTRERGSSLILDTSGEALRRALEVGVYLIKPNLREFAALFPDEDLLDEGLHGAAQGLVEGGAAEVVVVSLGASGALLTSAEGSVRFAAPTVPIVSRVGAGDSMVAGIVCELVRGASIAEAVRHGVAAGSAAVTTPGTELCRAEDVSRLLASTVTAPPSHPGETAAD